MGTHFLLKIRANQGFPTPQKFGLAIVLFRHCNAFIITPQVLVHSSFSFRDFQNPLTNEDDAATGADNIKISSEIKHQQRLLLITRNYNEFLSLFFAFQMIKLFISALIGLFATISLLIFFAILTCYLRNRPDGVYKTNEYEIEKSSSATTSSLCSSGIISSVTALEQQQTFLLGSGQKFCSKHNGTHIAKKSGSEKDNNNNGKEKRGHFSTNNDEKTSKRLIKGLVVAKKVEFAIDGQCTPIISLGDGLTLMNSTPIQAVSPRSSRPVSTSTVCRELSANPCPTHRFSPTSSAAVVPSSLNRTSPAPNNLLARQHEYFC